MGSGSGFGLGGLTMTEPYYSDDLVTLYHGDCLEVMRSMPDESVHAVLTDPPYALGFMGREWDTFGDVGRGAQARVQRAGEVTAAGEGHSTSAGPYLAAGVDSLRSAGLPFQRWCEEWSRECLRVLKPGGYMLAFGGSRTWHRLASAVEDAGFEIRDSIAWLYGSGFPKSLDVSKAIDKAARGVPQGAADPTSPNHGQYRTSATEGKRWENDKGQSYGAGGSRFLTSTASERTASLNSAETVDGSPDHTPDATATDWEGWGTALKPAFEPIVVGRKPLIGTVARNVLEYGTGALNIDATRVPMSGKVHTGNGSRNRIYGDLSANAGEPWESHDSGRWPTNVVLDESQAADLDRHSGALRARGNTSPTKSASGIWGSGRPIESATDGGDTGGAARFFPTFGRDGEATADKRYTDTGATDFAATPGTRREAVTKSRLFPTFHYEAKAPGSERPNVDGLEHPTVKPLDLMRWLVRLVTPPNGTVLEPFAGSGTTLEAALIEGFNVIGIEREADYLPLIMQRITKPLQQSLFGDLEALA